MNQEMMGSSVISWIICKLFALQENSQDLVTIT